MWTDSSTYVSELTRALRLLDLQAVERLSQLLHRTYLRHRTVFFVGNGGSASTASHLATDFSKLTTRPGQARLRCMALVDSVAALTAAGNDLAYEEVFVEQLRTFMEAGDVVVGISTSGRSRNILRAVEYANQRGAITFGITGADGGPLRAMTADSLSIPSLSVQQIEDLTTVAGHIACLATREKCLTADPSIEIDGVGARGTAETPVVAVNMNPAA
jgi:D-sedoheptulose 7-phosphate isomerase